MINTPDLILKRGTIIGGTGEFLGATGTVTSGKLDFVITITDSGARSS